MQKQPPVQRAFKMTAVACLVGTTAVFGGASKIQDQSTRAMGRIDAFVAGADDASSVYYNPAGLMRLSAPQFIGNLYFAHTTAYSSGPGFDETSDNRTYVLPTFFFGTPVGGAENVAAGIGVYAPFGLGARWGDNTNNATSVSLAEIKLISVNPTIAFALGERLSVGAGVDYFQSTATRRWRPAPQGEIDIEGEGNGWGYNLGLQWDLRDDVTVGLTYRSQVDVHYEGDIDDDINFLSGSADTKIKYPANATLAVEWRPTSKLRLEVAAEWSDWSINDQSVIYHNLPFPVIVQRQDWEDSWVLMFGAEYDLNEKWTVRGGYGYNETPVPASTADPSLPVGDGHALAVGCSYRFRENATLDLGLIVSYAEKRTLHNTEPNSPPFLSNTDYEAISTFLSMGLTWDF